MTAAAKDSAQEDESCRWLWRDRPVGRWQRHVRWVLAENVIFVDWRDVKSGYSDGIMLTEPEHDA